MSASENRVPRSSSSIAHEVLGALRGLTFVGGMRTHQGSGPVSRTLREFCHAREQLAYETFQLAQNACGLEDGTTSMFAELWPGQLPNDKSDAFARLAFYARLRTDVDVVDTSRVKRLAMHGLDCQLRNLLHAMILAAAERNPDQPERLRSLVAAAVHRAELGAADDPDVASRRAYVVWSVADLGDLLDPNSGAGDSARVALRHVADVLDAPLRRYA